MNYMGGKQKQSKYIVPILNNFIEKNKIENYYEPFCGGFNVGELVKCENIFASDISPTLIALLQQVQSDFSKICTDSSREQWDRCKKEYYKLRKNGFKEEPSIPLAEIGAIEWLGSYCSRGFPGGYGIENKNIERKYFNERLNNLFEQSKQSSFRKAQFSCKSYKTIKFLPNSLIYCDAPYANVKGYGANENFNYKAYYKWLEETAKSFPIFISEQNLPEELGAKIVWEKKTLRTIGIEKKGKKAVEKLFFLDLR